MRAATKRYEVYDQDEVERIAAKFRERYDERTGFAPLRKIVPLLGIAPKSAMSLVEAGFIGAKAVDGFRFCSVDDAVGLLSCIEGLAIGRQAGPDYFSPASVLKRIRGLTMAQVVEGVLDGRVLVAKRPTLHEHSRGGPPAVGLNTFVVELAGAMTIGRAEITQLSVSATALRLKMANAQVLELLALGFLAPSADFVGKARVLPSITTHSVEAFERRYVTTPELRRAFPALRMDRVLGKLEAQPLMKSSDKFCIYDRSVIEEIKAMSERKAASFP